MDACNDSQPPDDPSEPMDDENLQSLHASQLQEHELNSRIHTFSAQQKKKSIVIGDSTTRDITKNKQPLAAKHFSPNTPRKPVPVKAPLSPLDKGKGTAHTSHYVHGDRDSDEETLHLSTVKHPSKTHRRLLDTIEEEHNVADLTKDTPAKSHRKRRKSYDAIEIEDELPAEPALPQEIICTPLHEIKDYHGFSNVAVRITRAWYGKLYGKDRQRSLVFLIKDDEGTTMEVIATGTDADKWKSTVNAGHTYTIRNLMLGKTDKPFRAYRADDQLFVTANTIITPCADNGTIGTTPRYYHKLHRIKDLAGFSPCLFSTIGYVIDMTKWCRKEMNDNTLIKMVEVYLIDRTCYASPVVFTIWEDVLLKYGAKISDGFKDSFILIIHDVKAKKFAGEYRIESTGFTTLEFDAVENPEVKQLMRWIHHEFPKVSNEPDLQIARPSDQARNIITIDELLESTEDPPAYKQMALYDIVAAVSYIHINEELTYESCPKCHKKIAKSTRTDFMCENCGINQLRPITMFRIRAVLEDRTGQITAVLFGSQAQLILREPPQVIKSMQQKKTSNSLLLKHIKDCLGIVYNFTIKLTNANHRYIQTSGYNIHAATRVLRNYRPSPPMLEILGARHSDSEVETDENTQDQDQNTENATHDEDEN